MSSPQFVHFELDIQRLRIIKIKAQIPNPIMPPFSPDTNDEIIATGILNPKAINIYFLFCAVVIIAPNVGIQPPLSAVGGSDLLERFFVRYITQVPKTISTMAQNIGHHAGTDVFVIN